MPLHILFSVPAYKPAYRFGGPVLSVPAIAERLAARGNRVTVVTTNCNLDRDLDVPLARPVLLDGVEVWYFPRREYVQEYLPFVPYLAKSTGFLYSPGMSQALHRIVPGVDLVHTHLPFAYPTYIAAKVARRCGKPLFYYQRGVFDPGRMAFRSTKKRVYLRFIERPIMNRAVRLIALTPAEVDSYRAAGVRTPCSVIPNGIDSGLYRTSPSCSQWERWGIPDDALMVLFLGRLHPNKGADRMLAAFEVIHARFPNAFLVMSGPDELGMEASFQAQAAAANLLHRVIFTGMVSGDTKLDLLARANLFCLPSDGEGFSMAVLEAIASGTAVLISPGCHFDEVEAAGVGVVAHTRPAQWAAALEGLLADPGTLGLMGSRGPGFVAANYNWDHIADRLLGAYELGLQDSARRCPSRVWSANSIGLRN